mmetsp:Transcript_465/g.511  ORF Transcript_465/g.511 Transcript_465/m.511 type:complete len:191 (+) Transcript_465:274-846(+)
MPPTEKKISATPLMSTLHALEEKNDDEFSSKPTYGGLVRQMTGFSLSAMRASIRATTGLSLTASRTALRLFTGISATSILKTIASVFPPWFRYFLQPLFIIYYTPLMVLKYFIGSTKSEKEEAFAAHEKVIEGWKDAIRASEQAQENFALHVNEDGTIENLVPNSLSITDAIVQSLDIASTVKEKNDEQN